MNNISYTFFIDFDGTITQTDVCEALVKAFAPDGWQELNKRWENKELSTVACARQTFKLFNTNDPVDFEKLVKNIVLDKTFKEFVNFCTQRNYPIFILSDGYDYYIEYLLKREGLNIPYYSNKLIFGSEIDVITPNQSINCDLCGTCKTELMTKILKPNQKSIYIGDGFSDFCPAKHADFVFAKRKLYEYCLSINKEVYKFNNFKDVLKILPTII